MRAKYPVTMEPKPIKPSRGSGEAVCGSLPLPPSFLAVVVVSAEAALLSAGAAPVELVADWSAEGVVLAEAAPAAGEVVVVVVV